MDLLATPRSIERQTLTTDSRRRDEDSELEWTRSVGTSTSLRSSACITNACHRNNWEAPSISPMRGTCLYLTAAALQCGSSSANPDSAFAK